jgi:hypothetical protein
MFITLMLLQAASTPPSKASDLNCDHTARQSDQAFAAYSECLVRDRRSEAAAKKFVRMPPDTVESLKAAADLATGACLTDICGTVTLRFVPGLLRPAVFAALYKSEFGKRPAPLAADMPALKVSDFFDGPVDQVFAGTRGRLALGDCVVRADIAATRAFVLARPWTPRGASALPGVIAAMRGCLTGEQTLHFGRVALRGVLAEALYGMSLMAAASQASAPPSR